MIANRAGGNLCLHRRVYECRRGLRCPRTWHCKRQGSHRRKT